MIIRLSFPKRRNPLSHIGVIRERQLRRPVPQYGARGVASCRTAAHLTVTKPTRRDPRDKDCASPPVSAQAAGSCHTFVMEGEVSCRMSRTQGWRAFDTAPKDGTRILVFDDELKVIEIAWWQDGTWRSVQGPIGRHGFNRWMKLPAPPRIRRKR